MVRLPLDIFFPLSERIFGATCAIKIQSPNPQTIALFFLAIVGRKNVAQQIFLDSSFSPRWRLDHSRNLESLEKTMGTAPPCTRVPGTSPGRTSAPSGPSPPAITSTLSSTGAGFVSREDRVLPSGILSAFSLMEALASDFCLPECPTDWAVIWCLIEEVT